MKRIALLTTVSVIGLGLGLGIYGSMAAAEMATTQPKEKKAPKIHINGDYGKLTLTEEQTMQISKIQKETKEKIDKISDESDKSIEALLTEDQKKQLSDIEAANKERARESREKSKAKAADKTGSTTQPSK